MERRFNFGVEHVQRLYFNLGFLDLRAFIRQRAPVPSSPRRWRWWPATCSTTGGGAHPVTAQRLGDHFAAMVPSGRAINPTTKTNWEGVGVSPDIAVDPDKALDKAKALYYADLLKTEKHEGRRRVIADKLAEVE